MAALGHGRRSNLASEGSYSSDPLEITHGHRRGTNPLRPVLRINAVYCDSAARWTPIPEGSQKFAKMPS